MSRLALFAIVFLFVVVHVRKGLGKGVRNFFQIYCGWGWFLTVTLPPWDLINLQFFDEDIGGRKPFMKVGSSNVFSLSCQFYILMFRLKNIVCFSKWKTLLYNYIDLHVEAYEELSKTSFFRWRVLWSIIIDVHCTTE